MTPRPPSSSSSSISGKSPPPPLLPPLSQPIKRILTTYHKSSRPTAQSLSNQAPLSRRLFLRLDSRIYFNPLTSQSESWLLECSAPTYLRSQMLRFLSSLFLKCSNRFRVCACRHSIMYLQDSKANYVAKSRYSSNGYQIRYLFILSDEAKRKNTNITSINTTPPITINILNLTDFRSSR